MPINNEHLYNKNFMEKRQKWRDAYDVIAKSFSSTFGEDSILDVGCATGFLVEALRKCGFDSFGIDGSHSAQDYWPEEHCAKYTVVDITDPTAKLPRTNIVSALEIAEHLPQTAAETFITNLVQHRPNRILFTSAPPGQGGEGHINEQPYSYWIKLFNEQDYQLDIHNTCKIRVLWRTSSRVPQWYYKNFLVFQMGTCEKDSSSTDVAIEVQYLKQEVIQLGHQFNNLREIFNILSQGQST